VRPASQLEADADPSDPRLLDRLIGEAVPDLAVLLQGKFRLAADPGDETFSCSDLFEPAHFDDLIDRLALSYPDADRRAVTSMWTLYYFSLLTIVPIVLWQRKRHILPLDMGTMSVVVSKASGLPEAFLLPSAGIAAAGSTVFEALDAMVNRHMAPAIAFLKSHCRVSVRMLWCNAAGYMDWVLRELSPAGGEGSGFELFTEPKLAGGEPNPFWGTISRIPDPENQAAEISRRKVCCLRYRLPQVGGCGAACPIREGQGSNSSIGGASAR